MKNRRVYLSFLLVWFADVPAATVTLDPLNRIETTGSVVTVDLVGIDFAATDATTGGGVDLLFDASVLQVNGVTFGDSAFTLSTSVGSIDNSAGLIQGITVAELFNPPSGDFNIATVAFTAMGEGYSVLDLQPSTFPAPWLRASNGSDIDPGMLDGSVTVAAVPLPASFWLLCSGLVVLCRPLGSRNLRH